MLEMAKSRQNTNQPDKMKNLKKDAKVTEDPNLGN